MTLLCGGMVQLLLLPAVEQLTREVQPGSVRDTLRSLTAPVLIRSTVYTTTSPGRMGVGMDQQTQWTMSNMVNHYIDNFLLDSTLLTWHVLQSTQCGALHVVCTL